MINDIISRATEDAPIDAQEIARLFQAPLFSDEAALIQSAARRKSEKASGARAEIHAQVGLNVAPCPRNCGFCAFAAVNRVFDAPSELNADEAVARARRFETDGANAIYIMATANYDFGKFIDISREIRDGLDPETVLVANVGDFDERQAERLKEAGYAGVYHAIRMGEGSDTSIDPELRCATFRAARAAGLALGTCVEPVGHEHTVEELVEKTIITREIDPVFSGAARRICIPDTELGARGTVSEARLAFITAVVRLAVPSSVPGNCTHEPNVTTAVNGGANVIWAESGSNPRDTECDTEKKRGLTVADCRDMLCEAEWAVLTGPSRMFSILPQTAAV